MLDVLLNTGYCFFCNLIFPFKKRYPSIAFIVVLKCNGGRIEKKAKSPLCQLSNWPAIGIGSTMDALTSRWCIFRYMHRRDTFLYRAAIRTSIQSVERPVTLTVVFGAILIGKIAPRDQLLLWIQNVHYCLSDTNILKTTY